MIRRIEVLSFVLAGILASAQPAAAQFFVVTPVRDNAVIARNTVTAILNEYLRQTQGDQRQQIERMARRLSRLTDLRKYTLLDVPAWRIHDFWTEEISPLSRDYHAALNYGDRTGRAILAASHEVRDAVGLIERLSPGAARGITARLATLDAAAASLIASTHNAGLSRYNGRREFAAIEALEQHVVDPSDEHSTTAVLEKINGASLIATRQSQARVQLLASLVEELLISTKRTRDADAVAMNMQLTTWRDAAAANERFVAGTGRALQTWRQP